MKRQKVKPTQLPSEKLPVEEALAEVIQAEQAAQQMIEEAHSQVKRVILPEAEKKAEQYREKFINEVKQEIEQQRQRLLQEAREKAAEIEQQTTREAEKLKQQAETNWSRAVALVTQEIMKILQERS